MTRRDVFSLAGGAAALAAAGRLPLLGARTAPSAVAPIEGYLRTHGPGEGKARRLEYAVLRWTDTDPRTGETVNVEIGRLTIETQTLDGGVQLSVRQQTEYSQPSNVLEAEAMCRDDELLSLRSWRVSSRIEQRDDCLYEAEGSIDGGRGRLDDRISERDLGVLGATTVCQWALPAALALGKRPEGSFTMLEDLALVKPGQRLMPAATVRVPYADAEHELRSWAHTGYGVLPIHYLVDEGGAPQLMTQGALAWALQAERA